MSTDFLTFEGDPIRRLTAKPGEVFVLECDALVFAEVAERLREQWKHVWLLSGRPPPPLLVLGRDQRLSVADAP